MKKIFTAVKSHVKDNATVAKKHLQNNDGDGYIWFLFMTVALLLIFGALFFIMSTAINMRDIRTDVDVAADDVFTEIKQTAYDKLTDGATDFSFTSLTDEDVMKMMAGHLNASYSGSGLDAYIYKLDARNQLAYKIEDFEFEYIDQINDKASLLGDVNHDKIVDETDVSLAKQYIESQEAGTPMTDISLADVDINEDGIATQKDVLLLEGLVEYFSIYPAQNKSSAHNDVADNQSSALLMITFRVTVPINYGTVNFGDNVDDYYYHSTISFIPAM